MNSIPKFLEHLKTFGEYPVPFVQQWIDGKPDFRVIDPNKVEECVEGKLCAICGRKLGEYCWFIGSDECKEAHMFLDAWMHEECAEFASKTCPFVSGKRRDYSTRPLDESVHNDPHVSAIRPDKMYIFKTRTKKVEVGTHLDSIMFRAGIWNKITEIVPTE